MIVGPAMPAFASPLDDQATQATVVLKDLSAEVAKLPDSAATPAPPVADPNAPPPTPEEAIGLAASPLVASCCGKSLSKLNVIIGAIAKSLPAFVAKYKNTNLLSAALRMLVELPAKFGDLRSAFRAFKQATDKESAQAALASLGNTIESLHQTTDVAFQQELPPPGGQDAAQASSSDPAPPEAVKATEDSAKKVRIP
jgi:hypothetical protein